MNKITDEQIESLAAAHVFVNLPYLNAMRMDTEAINAMMEKIGIDMSDDEMVGDAMERTSKRMSEMVYEFMGNLALKSDEETMRAGYGKLVSLDTDDSWL